MTFLCGASLTDTALFYVCCLRHRLPITRLAAEVKEALDADPMYGPKHDRWRHTVGVEYEVVLEESLKSLGKYNFPLRTSALYPERKRVFSLYPLTWTIVGIPFETESDLRDKGSSRTPDILLQCPIGVRFGEEWRVVCWIDSKVGGYSGYSITMPFRV